MASALPNSTALVRAMCMYHRRLADMLETAGSKLEYAMRQLPYLGFSLCMPFA